MRSEFYHRYRHGYPAAVIDILADALHWMRRGELFRSANPLLRAGGGVAVVTNGTPLWRQDSDWSRGLRAFLERWLGTTLTSACGTDEQSRQKYRDALARAGFAVSAAAVDYVAELSPGELVGSVYSALPASRLPPRDQRPAFTEQVRAAASPHDSFREQVRVAILTGRLP